jgi:hypothetical protein
MVGLRIKDQIRDSLFGERISKALFFDEDLLSLVEREKGSPSFSHFHDRLPFLGLSSGIRRAAGYAHVSWTSILVLFISAACDCPVTCYQMTYLDEVF